MTCNPSLLATQAVALSALTEDQLEGIKTYLMAKRYGLQNTDLRPYVGAYASLPPYVLAQLRVYLLGGLTGAGVIDTSLSYYVIPSSLITAAQILILSTLTGTSTDPVTLTGLAAPYTRPGYPRLAAQVYILNRSNIGLQDLLNSVGFMNSLGEVCLTCGGKSVLPYAEAGLWCASGSSLFNDLFEVWNFDNSLVGNFAGYTFNNTNPSYVTGKINQGLSGDGVAGRQGTAPGTSIFNVANSFTVAAWTSATIGSPDAAVLRCLSATSGVIVSRFGSMVGSALYSITVRHSSADVTITSGSQNQNEFICAFGGYDASTDKVFLRLNNGAVTESAAFGVAPTTAIPDFTTCINTAGAGPASGFQQDILACWQRRLTSAEMDAFYNGGSGIQFPW